MPEYCRRFLVGVQFGPGDPTHDPVGVGGDAGHQMRLVVVDVGNIRRHIGMVAEKGGIKHLHGGRRITGTLQTYGGQVDVEVPAKTRHALRMERVEVAVFVHPASDQAGFVASNDAAVPPKCPPEWADRIGQHFTCIGPRVVGKPLAGGPIGDPSIVHSAEPTRRSNLP